MTTCDWPGCAAPVTHTVDISFPEGTHETWQACRAHDRTLKYRAVHSRQKAPPPPPDPPPTLEVCCSTCGRSLDEPASLSEGERRPCPAYGSLQRLHKITFVETLVARESLQLRSKHLGKGGWMTDVRTGDDYTRDLEGWGTLVREKDRLRDVYCEVITLYDGTVVASQARLTDHHD